MVPAGTWLSGRESKNWSGMYSGGSDRPWIPSHLLGYGSLLLGVSDMAIFEYPETELV